MKYILTIFFITFINTIQAAQWFQVEDVIHLEGGYHSSSILKINNKGNVIGLQYKALTFNEGLNKIFFYSNQTKSIFTLESLNSNYHVYPLDINDHDSILGYTDIDRFDLKNGRTRKKSVVLWKNLICEDLTEDLGVVYAESNQFISINNSGVLAGFGFEICDKITRNKQHSGIIMSPGVKRKKNTSVNLDNYYIRIVSLNEKGDVAGGLMYEDKSFMGIGHGMCDIPKATAFIWDHKIKKIIEMGNLTAEEDKYSFALSLNDHLQVVGGSEVSLKDSRGQYFWHAFFWENGNILDLGTLDSEEDSMSCSINNLGEVVGVSGGIIGHATHENKPNKAFYWSKATGMQNLNSMIDKDAGWNIVWAKDINDLGQIVAFAIKEGQAHVVILNPVK